MSNNLSGSPIDNYLINLQCQLIEQSNNVLNGIEANDSDSLTEDLLGWLELRDNILNCGKIEKMVTRGNLKTKFWFEVNNEEQLKIFNALFDKLYGREDKDRLIQQFLIAAQCKLIDSSKILQDAIESKDPIEFTNALFKWMDLKDVISYGVKIKNMINDKSYITKFGIGVPNEETFNMFNALFNSMSQSEEKEREYERFLTTVEAGLIDKASDLQTTINSGNSVDLTKSFYKWLQIKDILSIGLDIKNILNNDVLKTKFGITVNSNEQLELFNSLFDEMIEFMRTNGLFPEKRTR